MNMLIYELQALSANPLAWVVVGVLAAITMVSVVQILRCPYVNDARQIPDTAVETARAGDFRPGLRFGLMMLAGAALTLMGLFMIANGIRPAFALAAMVVGIAMILTEPTRLQIREQRRLVAAWRDAPGGLAAAQDRLNSSYTQLAGTNIALMLGVAGALLAF